jgi:hypothetical protein
VHIIDRYDIALATLKTLRASLVEGGPRPTPEEIKSAERVMREMKTMPNVGGRLRANVKSSLAFCKRLRDMGLID